jgi:hypothetical protein
MTSAMISACASIAICLGPLSAWGQMRIEAPQSSSGPSVELLRLVGFGPYGNARCGDGSGAPNRPPRTMMCFPGGAVWFVCTGNGYSTSTGGAQWQSTTVDCRNPAPAP